MVFACLSFPGVVTSVFVSIISTFYMRLQSLDVPHSFYSSFRCLSLNQNWEISFLMSENSHFQWKVTKIILSLNKVIFFSVSPPEPFSVSLRSLNNYIKYIIWTAVRKSSFTRVSVIMYCIILVYVYTWRHLE